MSKAKLKKAYKIPTGRDIEKAYGFKSIGEELEESSSSLRLPSRLLWLNYMLGGGVVYGKMIEVFGFESTGKTLLAKDLGFSAQSLGGVLCVNDAEYAFDRSWAKQNGLDLKRTFVYENNDIAKTGDWIRDTAIYWRSKLKKNEPIVLLVDSIAALEKGDFIGADLEGASAKMGNKAKALDEMYRSRMEILAKTGAILVMINQVRNKLGASMWESNETTPGGNATKFFATMRISLIASKMIRGKEIDGEFKPDQKGKKVGREVIVKVIKNKTYPIGSDVRTAVYFQNAVTGYVGYDRYRGLGAALLEDGIIKKKGSQYFIGDLVIAKSEEKIDRAIARDSKIRKAIIKAGKIMTISQMRERLEGIKENLYNIGDEID